MTSPHTGARFDTTGALAGSAATRLPRMAIMHTGTSSQLAALGDPALVPHQLQEVYLPDFEPGDFDGVDVLAVSDREHPELLRRHARELLSVAERGGIVLVFGENAAHTWLPGIEWEARPTNFWWWRTGEDHGMRLRSPEDPIWPYFTERAMIWHHHGIFQSPPGAVPIVVVEENGVEVGATTYIDRVTTPGEIFVTTMDPCFHHGAGFMPGATQLLYQTLRWAESRASERIAAGLITETVPAAALAG